MLGLFCQLFESSKKRLAVDKFKLRGHEWLQQDIVTELRSEIGCCGQKAFGRFVAMQYAEKCPHVIGRHKMAGAVRLDLIYDAYDSEPAFYCNDIPPEVSTPWRQCDFVESGSFIGPSNDFLPLSGLDLMSNGRVST